MPLITESFQTARLGHSFGLHRALDTLGAVIGIAIAIAYVLFSTIQGGYTRIFLFSMIPGIFGVCLLFFIFFIKEKKPEKNGTLGKAESKQKGL